MYVYAQYQRAHRGLWGEARTGSGDDVITASGSVGLCVRGGVMAPIYCSPGFGNAPS